jgi:hypothetical protein
MNNNSFHNQDLSELIYQVEELHSQKKESDLLINALQKENEHLKSQIRLHLIAVRPDSRGSRTGQGCRPYDERDLIISRLEAQVLTLTDILSTYKDRAESINERQKARKNKERLDRIKKNSPVDLTVAWRPKKNELNDRTILLAKRAARRKAKEKNENKQIESEQRDLLIQKKKKSIQNAANRMKSSKDKYRARRERRIAELMMEEMEREKRREESVKEGKECNSSGGRNTL